MPTFFSEISEADLQSRIRNPEASFALSMWMLQAAGGTPPSREQFQRNRLDWIMPDVLLIELDAENEPFYSHYGKRIAETAGFDMTGKKVSDFKGPMGTFYLNLYMRAFAEKRPFHSVHRLGSFLERPMWERVILPLTTGARVTTLFVVNRVLELGRDFSLVTPRNRQNGVFALQFLRDADGSALDLVIVGANKRALEMTGRRLDEVLDQSMRACFPGIVEAGLWDDYQVVARDRITVCRIVDYQQDGVGGEFDVQLSPYRDGVLIDFELLAVGKAEAA